MDRLNTPCECGKGKFVETSIHDDWDGILHCNRCNLAIKRHEYTPEEIERQNKRSIRHLKKMQAIALEEYHAKFQELEDQIDAIRAERGTKLKTPKFEEYYEEGRSEARGPHGSY